MTKTLIARPEHKGTSSKKTMTGLYTGVSAVALMLGAVGGDAHAVSFGTTITKATKSFVVGTKQHFDFVDIHAPIGNNVVNNGTIGPGDSPSLTVDGPNGGSVGGNIINNGLISGTDVGIAILSTSKVDPVGGMIINDGLIQVAGVISKASFAAGITVTGPSVSTSIVNSATISVFLPAAGVGHTVGGILISSTGSLASSVTNNGIISASGLALGGTSAQMLAIGVGEAQFTGPGPATVNTITNNTGSLIDADAVAFASAPGAAAFATAIGAGQRLIGSSGTANFASVSNATGATISARAFASAFASTGVASANAVGVSQFAVGGLSITQNANNSGTINATAIGFVLAFNSANASANATGVAQNAAGSPTITQSVINAGDINVSAFASGFSVSSSNTVNANGSSAFALGVGQSATGGTGTISNTLNVTNSSQGSINVFASAVGSGSVSPDGLAFATGVSQSASGGGSQSLTFNNSGALNVGAFGGAFNATTSATASADVVAVRQRVSATAAATSIALGITNAAFSNGTTTFTGSINVTATASATGLGANAFAGVNGSAVMVQVVGGAPAGSNVTLGITNQGNMDFNFLARATGTSATANTDRNSGYWQQINGTALTAAATFSNATGANYSVNASAFAKGVNATASATAIGGWQTITGGQSVSATVNNDGTFNVAALATATGNSPYAFANIDTGLYQTVNASGGAGSTASATITNTSFLSLDLDATATAVGSTFANASASISFAGIYQGAAGETASVSLDNSGAITMDVNAFAAASTAAADASAFATILAGVQQSASAPGGSQLSASVDFTNSGDIELSAFASANAPDNATASATIGTGFDQNATNADDVSATFTNTVDGSIIMNITAMARGSDVSAQADNTNHVINQDVTAGDDDVSASAVIVNDGDITVNVFASGFATDGTGFAPVVDASIFLSYAFQQSVFDGADSLVSFTNNGTIVFNVTALAFNALSGDASVDFDTVFYMSASANGGTSDTVTGIFTNNGLIDLNLNATVTGGTTVDADNNLSYFLLESVEDASVASFTVTNSVTGIINVDLVANASATGDASASASITSLFEISAYADSGDQESATVTIVNHGIIDVNISANATGADADAYAAIDYAFYHIASDGDTATVDFTNTNSITFDLNAFALGVNDADATASFDSTIFYFSASANASTGTPTTATSTFLNTSTGSLIFDAQATAMGTNGTGGSGASAFAFASIDSAINQYAYDGFTGTALIQNDGTLSFIVGALASNALDASASVSFGYGIDQSASATGAIGSSATATINNTSAFSLDFILTAQAFGSTDADASAEFDDTIIEQDAYNADTAAVAFTNSGAFNVLVQATAVATNGPAEADASIDYGMSQSATASGGDNTSATVDFTNTATGTIDWLAKAVATALGTATTNDTASADATIDDFLYQDADGADTIRTSFTNDGTINYTAMASALGADANASAFAGEFVSQDATNSAGSDRVTGTVEFTNTGDITIIAQAIAMGTNGTGGIGRTIDASATIETVFSQNANQSDVEEISFINSATGTIDVQAIAIATNGSDAQADAELSYGIYQTQGSHAAPNNVSGDVTIDNDGTISFLAWAQATGTNTADAYAEFDNTIVYQSSHAAGITNTLFDNSGNFTVDLMALASASAGDASATVDIDSYFIYNAAYADAGTQMTATATINNSGLLSLLAVAQATGATSATASVDFSGTPFYQSATAGNGTNAATATIEFNNTATGTIDMQLLAHAIGTDAFASASFSQYLVYQSASASDGALASASLTNDGTMNFLAQATALGIPTGTTSLAVPASDASAFAYFESTLIYQSVDEAVDASATISNNGTMNFTLIALASNASDASATASFGYGFYQTVDVSGTSLQTGGTASATVTNTSTTSLNFTAIAQAIGITRADASAEFDDTIIYQTAEGETATATVDNSGAFNIMLQATAIAVGNGTTGNAYASASIDYGFSQNANANGNDGDRLFAGTYFDNSGTIVFSNFAMASGTTDATAYAYNDFGLYQYPDNADVVVAEFDNSGSFTMNATAWAKGSDAYAFASTKTLVSQSANAGDDEVSADVLINNTGVLSGVARATAIGTDGSAGPGNTATATATMDRLINQYAYNGENSTATLNNDGTLSGSAIANALNADDVFAGAYMDYGISQTAEGENSTVLGTSATATITNTSLTSLDVTLFAHASGITSADATASLSQYVIFQSVENAETATILLDNSGAMTVDIMAMATAVGDGTFGSAYAFAYMRTGIYQSARANYGDQLSADVTFNNSGTFNVLLGASAVGTTNVTASAYYSSFLLYQTAYQADNASVAFNNTGTVSVVAIANASGGSNVDAYAFNQNAGNGVGFFQGAFASDDNVSASATFTNSSTGDIDMIAIANATGSASATSVYASAAFYQYIVQQSVSGALNSSALIQNDGSFDILATAFASNPNSNDYAGALVELESGIVRQSVNGLTGTLANGGVSSAILNNTASLSWNYIGMAEAHGGTSVTASAYVEETYIFQGAFANEVVSNEINNSGSMTLIVDALAIAAGNGTSGYAFATAWVNTGIYQSADAGDGGRVSASNTINNVVGPPSTQNGSIVMLANAKAVGTTEVTANAYITTAVYQYVNAGATISNTFNNNTGSFLLMADADAIGGTSADANATATRVWQTVAPTSAAVDATNTFLNRNSASFVVDANAKAVNDSGSQAQAYAYAAGVSQYNASPGTQPVFNAVFVNDSEDNFKVEPASLFQVRAFASASGGSTLNSANAFAEGYRVYNNTNTMPILDITNKSTFRVFATAIGSTATATAFGMVLEGGELTGTIHNAGLIDVRASAPGGSALAIGVQLNSAINNTTFTNRGTISVLAIGSTTAIGVYYGTGTVAHTLVATSLDHATFINDGGTLWAGENNGTLSFGTVIDTTNAPNAVLINLQGVLAQGNIWGNINISGDDNILVSNGMTYFAGMINNSVTFTGDMTISSGGTLTMASTGTGPFVAYVSEYTQTASGTLAVNLTPSTPTNGLGQINAITANLGGTIQANVAPGLYANSQTYQDVVVASTLNGTWANSTVNTNTPLLSLTAIYPGDGTADLALTRNSFASPAGLTINQRSAGLGLDGGYSTALTGAFGSMVSNLFTLSTAAYIGALEQLHGSEHVQNLRSNLWSLNLLNYALDERVNSGTFSNDRTNNSDSIIRRGETTFWASYQGTTGDLEGDVEASGYKITQDGFYAGFDHAISDDILIGFAAGFYRSRLNFTNGSDKDDEGVQLAVYGAYDNQQYYLRANFALGYYNADVNRMINLPTQIGTARGDYNVNVMSFYGEAGRRFEVGENVFVTPFGALNYVSAENKRFTETGTTGANLALPDNKVKSFTGDVGVRFAASYQTGSNSVLIPELTVKYRREFKDEVLSINSSFAGAAGSGFSVISSHVDNSSYIIGGGVRFSQGDKLEISLMYSGRFNSQITEHGIGLRLSLLLGDRK